MPSKLNVAKRQQNAKSLLPCKTCPWRVDTDVWAIPGYAPDKAARLVRTASLGEGDAFQPIMACHNSTDSKMYACKGYLAQEGWNNLNVRLLLARGNIDNPAAVLEACEHAGLSL